MSYKISLVSFSVIGLGFVGSAIKQSLEQKGMKVKGYDKYKASDTFKECLHTEVMFLCLPTLYDEKEKEYDKSALIETCSSLSSSQYKGIVVIKSTVEPGTTNHLSQQFPHLQFVHNPEFLTARTAFHDVHHQTHIVLGKGPTTTDCSFQSLREIYQELYPHASISCCSCTESEAMKIFINSFYAVKVQYFTELYMFSQQMNCNYDKIVNMMLTNGWINPMHTKVPGPDGHVSYGGYCFPKDTNALCSYLERHGLPHHVLASTIEERNTMREETYM